MVKRQHTFQSNRGKFQSFQAVLSSPKSLVLFLQEADTYRADYETQMRKSVCSFKTLSKRLQLGRSSKVYQLTFQFLWNIKFIPAIRNSYVSYTMPLNFRQNSVPIHHNKLRQCNPVIYLIQINCHTCYLRNTICSHNN